MQSVICSNRRVIVFDETLEICLSSPVCNRRQVRLKEDGLASCIPLRITIPIQILSFAKFVSGLLYLPFYISASTLGRCTCPNVRSPWISWNKLGANVGKVKHFVLWGVGKKKKRNKWKSQQSFSKQDNLCLISYLLNESTREQQLYVSLISFPRTRSVFYPLGLLTAKTNPQQHRMLTSLSSPSFILWIQPRLPWCNNPTRQYASLVLALINWDGGAWGWCPRCGIFCRIIVIARSS